MNTGSSVTLNNGLTGLVDWLAFTLPDSVEPSDAMSLLGYSKDEFQSLSSGKFGYRSRLITSSQNLNILYDGNEGMGVHVIVTGSGIADVLSHYFEKRLVSTPFGTMAYEADTEQSTVLIDLFREICLCGRITRLDLSVDDFGARFFTPLELSGLMESGQCSTRYRNYNLYKGGSTSTGEMTGCTFNLGSRESACYLRVYDKQLEQNAKRVRRGESLLTEPWIRWELELKEQRANSAVQCLIKGMDLGDVIMGILANMLRLINKDNDRKCRCSTLEKWELFLAGVAGLRLYQPPEPRTIEDCLRWIEKQCALSLAAVLVAHDGDLSIFMELVNSGRGRFKPKHIRMIEEYQSRIQSK